MPNSRSAPIVIGDAAQLGGVKVIRPDGTIAWSRMAGDVADNAGVEEVLEALRDAARD